MHQNYLEPYKFDMQAQESWSPRKHKFAMNKALEQKLIGPMEESHTTQQSPIAVVNGALSKEIENRSKMS